MGDLDLSYGLGVGTTHLSCGADYVGHVGGVYGYSTISGATPDGRAMTYAFTKTASVTADLKATLERTLCP
jgi:D-alanyl-D-alanine carboxypeptidase